MSAGNRANAAPELSHEQTVPKSIAHRWAVSEVFVTDSAQVADNEFLLAWQLPRAHLLWADRHTRHHDPFASAEAARQGTFVVLHRHLGVQVGVPFSLQRFEFQVSDLEPYLDDQHRPLQGLLRYRITEREERAGQLNNMTLAGELEIAGRTVMTIGGDIVFMSRADYEALRAFQRANKPITPGAPPPPTAEPIEPELVGRSNPRNVAVGRPVPGKEGYPVVVDRTHPSFFDHDYDHVPGPFTVEGFRQMAVMTAHRSGVLKASDAVLTGLLTSFTDFGEFEAPLFFQADEPEQAPGGRVAVRVGLRQFGKEIAMGRIELAGS